MRLDFGDALDARRLQEALRFLVKLNVFAVPLYAILIFNIRVAALENAVGWLAFNIINAAGLQPSMSGNLITIPVANGGWGAFIDWDCTGWKSMLAFFALVMATNRKIKVKAWGLLIFIPMIFVVNVLRIGFMFWYASVDLTYYDFVHAAVWSWGMLAAVLLFWAFWMKRSGARKNKYIPGVQEYHKHGQNKRARGKAGQARKQA